MSLFFLRHVKTYNNVDERLSGRTETDIIPHQNVELTQDNLIFDIVYSSTSIRCRDTLKLINDLISCEKIYYTETLVERSLGKLENMPKSEAEILFPSLFINGRIGVDKDIPDGETINDVKQRVNSLVETVLSIASKHQCLVCSHNQTLKIMYAMINKITITDSYWHDKDFKQGVVIKVI